MATDTTPHEPLEGQMDIEEELNSCANSTKKEDHSFKTLEEPKIYILPIKGELTAVKVIAECTVCGVEECE